MLEVRRDGVLIRQEEVQNVVLLSELLARHNQPLELKRSARKLVRRMTELRTADNIPLIEGKVVVKRRLHVLDGVKRREEIEQLGQVQNQAFRYHVALFRNDSLYKIAEHLVILMESRKKEKLDIRRKLLLRGLTLTFSR